VWTNYITGEKFEGGCWRREKHGYMSLPLMVRPNSVIAVGNVENKPDYDYADGVTLHVFELEEGRTAATKVYNTSGEPELEFSITLKNNKIDVEAKGTGKAWNLILRGISSIKSVDNAACEKKPLGMNITPNRGINKLSIEI